MAFTPSTIFITLTGTILLLIGVVVILERFINKKKAIAVANPAYAYTAELKELKKITLTPQEMLTRIDSLAKQVITGQSTTSQLDYSQIAENNKEKHHITNFCLEMSENLYAGQHITQTQVRDLLSSLEDLLKGEGKLMLITPKKEILEGKSSFFFDKIIENTAKKIAIKIKQIKDKKEKTETKKEEIIVKEQIKIEEPEKEDKMPEFKKEILIKNDKSEIKGSDKAEYKYIESVDVLDRIQNKIKDRKTVKI